MLPNPRPPKLNTMTTKKNFDHEQWDNIYTPPDNKTKSRAWVACLNNYAPEEDITILKCALDEKINYAIIGKEIGKKNGTPHLQMYFYFKNDKSFATLKKRFNPKICWHTARGTATDSFNYICNNPEKPNPDAIVWGEKPLTSDEKGILGKRHWEETWDLAKIGEVEKIHPAIRIAHYNTIKKIRADYQPQLADINSLDHEWIWGEPGTFKSKVFRKEHPIYFDKQRNKWWDGYKNEDVVLIDDFDHEDKYLGSLLKRWADHYPFNAEVKGSSISMRPKMIVVTSNYQIKDLWADRQLVMALERRFKQREIKKGDYKFSDFGLVDPNESGSAYAASGLFNSSPVEHGPE